MPDNAQNSLLLGEIKGTLGAVNSKVNELVESLTDHIQSEDESRRRLYERVERSEERSEHAFRAHTQMMADLAGTIGALNSRTETSQTDIQDLKKKVSAIELANERQKRDLRWAKVVGGGTIAVVSGDHAAGGKLSKWIMSFFGLV